MPAKRRRRTPPVSGGNSPGWQTTYGDMVTLLLTFFVMLFAFSSIDAEQFRAIIASFQGSLGILDRGMTISQDPAAAGRDSPAGQLFERNPLEHEETQNVLRAITAFQAAYGLHDAFSVEATERGVVIHFTDRVLFDTGKAELKPEAVHVLEALAAELKQLPHAIRVEGHTDNVPIHNPIYPSNWELSTARASRVVRFFIDVGGIDPARLSAVGYGEYRPIATNETPEGRARNRRVDVVLLRSDLEASEPVSAILSP